MDLRTIVSETEDNRRPSWAVSLGLAASESPFEIENQLRKVQRATALWPAAIYAQLAAIAVTLTVTIAGGAYHLAAPAGIYAGILFGFSLTMLLVSRSRIFKRAKPHLVILSSLPVGVILGASLALLSWQIAPLMDTMTGWVCFVALSLSAILMLTALMPLQATALMFFGSTIITGAAHSGDYQIVVVSIVIFMCFWIASLVNAGFDIRESAMREKTDRKALRANRLLEEFEANGNGWFWETDRSGTLVYLSPRLVSALSRPGHELIGKPFTSLIRTDGGSLDGERTLGFHLSTRSAFTDVTVQANFDDEELWWSISGRPIIDQIGQFRGYAGSGTDLTEKRRSEAEANRLARYDALTGLANRQEMRLALDKALGDKEDTSDEVALFLLDLDRFKAVNDTMGHPVGDELLKQVSKRLFRVVGDLGMVGRLGGDEFEVVLPEYTHPKKTAQLAQRIISELSQPYMIDGVTLTIGCSIGVAIAPYNGTTSEELVRNADLALYAAKADGRGVHRFYETEMHAGAKKRKRVEDDLRIALSKDELHVAYQPQVSTTTEKIVGYEALVRWNHPSRGAISPEDFVPVAEDIRLIEQIGEWILRKSCEDAAKWPGNARVAVNVSPIQFANPNFPKVVTSALANSNLAPERLELELTESVFLDESADPITMFKTLKRIGVRLALDDFGTGYSALGYLKTAPFDKIKIDQSFIRGAAVVGNRNAAIIKAIVSLAETLYMETTAEGVEMEDEIELVKQLGCSHIQGYIYGKPMAHEDVLKQLGDDKGIATAQGHRASRSPRRRILRTANLEVDGGSRKGVIRNISATGAMIEGLGDIEDGTDILIEIIEGQMFKSTVRWSDKERIGIEFARNFDLERLKEPTEKSKPKVLRAASG
ncbi:EAL domain-containing protein [Parasphingopyxis sp.]|uniref:EAL domain-containing protein n=1 Tax=Parasphingopyxis sp. TaxID=1920299 RepID=UPI0026180006|nr:EAL domain-containing protein [Parasphingopyxis sp.]